MTFTEAAAEILRLTGKPLHYREITELAIEKNLLSHVGKNPEVTMGSRLVALTKKDDESIPIVRVRPGVFALREWEDGKPRGKVPVEAEASEEDAAPDINALEVGDLDGSEPTSSEEPDEDDDNGASSQSPEDALRADLAASAADLFDDEEDDDQPILAPSTSDVTGDAAGQGAGVQGEGGGRRRRRRRRRRGGGGDRASDNGGPPPQGGGAGFTVSADGEAPAEGRGDRDRDRDPLAPAPRPMIRDRQQIMSRDQQGVDRGPSGEIQLSEGEELSGRDLADAALVVLGAFDRNGGPVGLRSIVDALVKRGRLSGDPAACATQLAAALRADNLRRQAQGLRPRFRFSNGRCAPTDWILGPDLVRMEQDAQLAIDRYRDTARRTLLRRIQELPGHAFVELALVALEKCGMSQVKLVKRAGSPGGEAHFAAVHRTGSDEIRTAIVIRKDGREIGRERVADLRGALHHYDVGGRGPAVVGWLITTGQVLSGAREEASATPAPPIALYDGLGFCKLMEDQEVGVVRTRMTIAIPDLELLETLRG